jgi:hypothetical protein
MLALLDEVQAEIGGTWKNEDSPTPAPSVERRKRA